MKTIYLVCPVRNCDEKTQHKIYWYVRGLEAYGNYKVHYPPRDVDQNGTADEICIQHVKAMADCDEVHFWWDEKSRGSLFDFGMAYMLKFLKTGKHIKFVLANRSMLEASDKKNYTNYLIDLAKEDEEVKNGS